MKRIPSHPDYGMEAESNEVFSFKYGRKRLLKQSTTHEGYKKVGLCKNGRFATYLVHRLKLETFIGPCPPGKETRHRNGVPADNRLSNLRWATPKKNCADKIKHGTTRRGKKFPPVRGEKQGQSKLTDVKVRLCRKLHNKFGTSCRKLAKMMNVCPDTIWKVLIGKTWTHVT